MRSPNTLAHTALFFLVLVFAGIASGSDTPTDEQTPAARLVSVRT